MFLLMLFLLVNERMTCNYFSLVFDGTVCMELFLQCTVLAFYFRRHLHHTEYNIQKEGI